MEGYVDLQGVASCAGSLGRGHRAQPFSPLLDHARTRARKQGLAKKGGTGLLRHLAPAAQVKDWLLKAAIGG